MRSLVMDGLNDLEAAVLDMLLVGDIPALALLRKQRQFLRVRTRKLTGVGFFTEFDLPPDSPNLSIATAITFGDVLAEIEGMKHGAGFLIIIEDGLLATLEGYSNAGEIWPEVVSSFRLRYWRPQRDLSAFLSA
jgi:hypothetical protein